MGKIKMASAIVFGIGWFMSGLFINLLQFVCYITLYPLDRNIFRLVNYYLNFCLWTQLVAFTVIHGKSRVRIFFKDDESEKLFGKEYLFALANHSTGVDWLFFWIMGDYLNCLQVTKSLVKQSARYLPVMGWSWFFSEFLFLQRSWKEDQDVLTATINRYNDYTIPPLINIMCEGTRKTDSKFKASVEFANSRGLEPYKHHLYPRTKGAVHCIMQSKNNLKAIYNVELAFPAQLNAGSSKTLLDIFRGEPIVGDIYCERIPAENLDLTEESLNKLILDLFREKDILLDDHLKNGHFPGHEVSGDLRLVTRLNFFFWQLMSLIVSIYVIFWSGGIPCYITLLIWGFGFISGIFAVRYSDASKTGSKYGSDSKPKDC